MAICRTGPHPTAKCSGLAYSAQNLSTRLITPLPLRFIGKFSKTDRKRHGIVCCSLRKITSPSSMESQEDVPSALSVCVEEELDHVIRFNMSDFKSLDRVSVGLGGRV